MAGEKKVGEAEFYSDVSMDLYKTYNPVRSQFLDSRWHMTRQLVEKYYKKGDMIVDVGCGPCKWNAKGMKIYGIDINKTMLDNAVKRGALWKADAYDFTKGLRLKDSSADLLISMEVLEHVVDYKFQIQEFRRVLKPGGKALVSVPYDVPLSLWWPLYKAQCFVQGTLLGNDYYKAEGGHIQHFSMKGISSAFEEEGFVLDEKINHAFMTIFLVATCRK
jgi:ubiquinone/menaquinone biosynthesis C-methylase UbiE